MYFLSVVGAFLAVATLFLITWFVIGAVKRNRQLRWARAVCLFVVLLFTGLVILVTGSFGFMNEWLTAFVAFAWWCGGVHVIFMLFHRDSLPTIQSKLAPTLEVGLFGIFLVLAVVLSTTTKGLCVSFSPNVASTEWQRSALPPPCAPGPPCHVYITLPKDGSSAVIVNFHTSSYFENASSLVLFDTVSRKDLDSYRYRSTGWHFTTTAAENTRVVHWVDVTDLSPDTVYYFRAGGVSSFSPELSFRTLPSDGSSLPFLTGGDIGLLDLFDQMSSAALKWSKDPKFVLVGGDLAYANAFPTCYAVWDSWFDIYQRVMVTSEGHLIPMIMSIGNHEAGGFGLTSADVPFYTKYFPHELGLATVPPQERPLYHTHLIGENTAIYVLDSDVATRPDGRQLDWLEAQFRSTKNRAVKMALYHAPLWPSRRPFETPVSAELRSVWGPTFDRFNLSLGLENHDHSYKRSHVIKNNEVASEGTLYIGDGCWGVNPRDVTPRWYLARSGALNHIWGVVLNSTSVSLEAIDITGRVFDTVVGSVAPYRVQWSSSQAEYEEVPAPEIPMEDGQVRADRSSVAVHSLLDISDGLTWPGRLRARNTDGI